MRKLTLAVCVVAVSSPAIARQEHVWIEKVAVLAVGQGICGVPLDNDAMQIAIGSAMIQLATTKAAVIKRGRKRARFIVGDISRRKTGDTFCQAFSYYLENGYPR